MALTVYRSIQYGTSMTVKHLGVTLRTDLLKYDGPVIASESLQLQSGMHECRSETG